MNPLVLYLLVISSISLFLTLYDKSAAIHKRWRIKESTLFTVSLLGGALAMVLTMVMIRHKTKHKRFMIGLPLLVIVHIITLWFIY